MLPFFNASNHDFAARCKSKKEKKMRGKGAQISDEAILRKQKGESEGHLSPDKDEDHATRLFHAVY